jgi:hypothetical protein
VPSSVIGQGGFSPYAITAASSAGRVLWCAARKSAVAFDIFGGEGGSAAVLAHALQGIGRVVTFERSSHTTATLRRTLAPYHPLEVEGNVTIPDFRADIEKGRIAADVLLFLGAPYPPYDSYGADKKSTPLTKYMEEPSHLEALCDAISPGLIVLDPTSPIIREWLVMERACQPDYVFIFNSNLPGMASWVREKLLLDAAWAEALTGVNVDPAAAGDIGPVGSVLVARKWSLMMRWTKHLAQG